ncbi:MAG: TIGR03619 family F420-dependent LLM class oxidoreductase [Myxococcota bacterium]|jgi:probable F420-dependent oxidoreductase|nr:TIGR03619 family F420-dependent LLM class oxidoreductase [Myxococcota bacterium]
MKISYAQAMCDPSFYLPIAFAAEEAGYDGMVVPDSLGYPGPSDTKYPYSADGDNAFIEDKPFIEPFVLISAMGAVTQRLRFTTLVMKLPVRLPVVVAKQATSLAVMTNNRFSFGVGLSPWPEDFAVTGQPWKGRGKRMDEMIEILRGLQKGDYFEFSGDYYEIPRFKICPVPSEPIPILIGGHSEAALRRAARIGDGWMHAGGPPDELPRYMARLAELRRDAGRDHLPFEVHAISPDAFTVDGIRRLEDQGVTNVVVGFRDTQPNGPDTQTLEKKLGDLRDFADKVLAKL